MVVLAAVLLVAIRWTAGRILGLAGEILGTAGRIVDNTAPIWRLDDVRGTSRGLLRATESIEGRARSLADALEGPGGGS